MRRLLSILLLLAFVLPSAAPALAMGMGDASGLPACCRRDGKHQCMLSMAERERLLGDRGPRFEAKREMCPCCPNVATSVHVNVAGVPPVQVVELVLPVGSHPKGVAQTRSMWRVARERSRGKRGPPVLA